ncbi:MAG TPA: glycoside hydrolase family 2 TIM barrel-domain containing protein, partial [Thermoanaerobaculia bacterium]|nr:glycoside hydrolase family 2 TIM barrel-domain containing protein [Thermoanaerobaculia bacterium]
MEQTSYQTFPNARTEDGRSAATPSPAPVPAFVPPDGNYPRPQLRRDEWTSLDGAWEFAIDANRRWRRPDDVKWEGTIRVPFSPETPASGVANTGFFVACWYRRALATPELAEGERLFLHFGAVDYSARVWVNGYPAARHDGGYTPFSVDLTPFLRGREQVIVVRAQDDPADLAKPRGKQDWKLRPHGIWYPRTTGIWQTVWLEKLPRTWIHTLRWTPNLERWEIGIESRLAGLRRGTYWLAIKLRAGTRVLVDDSYRVIAGEVNRRVALSDPGIDDFRNELLWSPESPRLIQAQIDLWADRGEKRDSIRSYTALRSIAVDGDRFLLNGRPYPLRMVLDQGYWPETGMTPADTQALRRDVELARAMGFNGVRKHQKIEDPRYLYWADRLGLLVWEEMPSAYRFTQRSIDRLTREWSAVLARDYSHPCIVAWVPFNESWGVPNLPAMPAERHYVHALYHLTRTFDVTRPVIGNDGWESIVTDIIGIHDYDADPDRLTQRYRGAETLPALLRRERPGGRLLVLDQEGHKDQPVMLTEFGGIALSAAGEASRTWGYSRAADGADFGRRFSGLLQAVRCLEMFAGFCYTQFADTYQEANGLLRADRTPKIPIETIARATSGPIQRMPGRAVLHAADEDGDA